MTNLNMLKIIIDSINQKNPVLVGDLNLDKIADFFDAANKNKEKFNYAYLNYYLWNNLSKDSVAKRKTTSRDFEDILAVLFNGVVTDEVKRVNTNINDFFVENSTITGFAVSNKREKSDIKLPNDYVLSVKTLMHNNNEINFGSFEKTTLFGGLNVEHYLNERKGVSSEIIGLGSKPRLLNLLLNIQESGNYTIFKNRFNQLIEFVFSDDLIILIKNSQKIDLYFIKGQDFTNLIRTKSEDPKELLSVLNRWEGNSIRMNRDLVLSIGRKVSFDFSFLESHIIKKILDTEELISKYFFEYINNYPNNKEYKDLIMNQCNLLLDDIDDQIDKLI